MTIGGRQPPVIAPTPLEDGALLLDSLRGAIARYVVMPTTDALVAVTLWIAATHAQRVFQHAPRLIVKAPAKRCGKSRLLDVLAATVRNPIIAAHATAPALFRSIDADDPPTILLDEADRTFGKRPRGEGVEDLVCLYDAGFGRGRPVLRVVGKQHEPRQFETFAMAALAGIGDFAPDTIVDRAITVSLQRRAPGESVSPWRTVRDETPLHALRNRIGAWSDAHLEILRDMEPPMPVEDRAADVWEPLLAFADAVGGDWPGLGRAACIAMTADADAANAEESIGATLLVDVAAVFAEREVAAVSSEELVRALRGLEESPWDKFELQQRDLAWRLKPYGVRPDRVRIGDRQVRGYRLADFSDAFHRYLSPQVSQGVTPSFSQVTSMTPSGAVTEASVTDIGSVTAATREGDGVTDSDALAAAQDVLERGFGCRLEEVFE